MERIFGLCWGLGELLCSRLPSSPPPQMKLGYQILWLKAGQISSKVRSSIMCRMILSHTDVYGVSCRSSPRTANPWLEAFRSSGYDYASIVRHFFDRSGGGKPFHHRQCLCILEYVIAYLSSGEPLVRLRSVVGLCSDYECYHAWKTFPSCGSWTC